MNPVRLGWLRLVRGSTGLVTLAGIIALCSGSSLVVAATGEALARDAVARSIRALPQYEQIVSVSFDGSDADIPKVQAATVDALAKLDSTTSPREYYTFRPMWDGSHSTYQLAGSESLPEDVMLTDGRMPSICSPELCEVVQVSPGDVDVTQLGISIVGHATLQESSPLHTVTEPSATLLIASSALHIRDLPSMAAVGGSTLWAAQLPIDTITESPLQWLTSVSKVAGSLSLTNSRLVVHVPDAAIRSSTNDALAAQHRLLGIRMALAVMAAAAAWSIVRGSRSAVHAVRRMTSAFAARTDKWSAVWLVSWTTVTGFVCGAALAYVAAKVSALPEIPHSAWGTTVLAAIATLLVSFGALAFTRRSQLAFVTVGTTFIAAAFSNIDSYFAVPLSAVIALAALPLLTMLRGIRWSTPLYRSVAANLRPPLVAALAMTTFATGSCVAAVVQQAALTRNAVDRVTFTSPLAQRLIGGDKMPLADATVNDYANATGDAAFPVIRVPATARAGMLEAATVQVLAVPALAWNEAPPVTHQTGVSLQQLASLASFAEAPGIGVPAGDRLQLLIEGLVPTTDLLVWVYDGSGRTQSLLCAPSDDFCTVALPATWQTPTILGLTLRESPNARARREHAAGEGKHDVIAPQGTFRLTKLDSSAGAVDLNLIPGASAGVITRQFDLSNGPTYVPFVADSGPLHVVADEATGVDAVLAFSPGVDIAVRATANSPRMPTTPDRFAVADFNAAVTTFAAHDPSLISVSEMWLSTELPSDSVLLSGKSQFTAKQLLQVVVGSAAGTWSSLAFATLAATLIALIVIIGAGLADAALKAMPPRSWIALGATASEYRRSMLLVVGIQTALVISAAGAIAMICANAALQLSGVDLTGRIAEPPVAQTWPLANLAICACAAATAAFIGFALRMELRLRNAVTATS